MRGVRCLWLIPILASSCDAGEKAPVTPNIGQTAEAKHSVDVGRDDDLRERARLDLLARDLGQFEHDVSDAVDMVTHAVSEPERDAAKVRLRTLQKTHDGLKRRIAEARARAERRHRSAMNTLECSALRKGCY